jgi:allantoate deiminase
MPVNVQRIRRDIEAIALCTQTRGSGATRPTFSDSWSAARDYVISQAKAAGCTVNFDAAGNLHARPTSLDTGQPVYLCGSHIDTVPHGGDYDGVAGVSVALELLRSAHEDGVAVPLELIVFAEEEGPTFGLGMLGSRAWVGELTDADLGRLRNSDGQSYLQAGKPFGVDPLRLLKEFFNPERYLGLIEVHIEQGPGMWQRDQRLAVVHSIAGRRQFAVAVHGQANHAGATSMQDRSDALTTAAKIILGLEHLASALGKRTVITVGRLIVHPNAINVIPDRVEFTIDFRAADDETLKLGDAQIQGLIKTMCGQRRQRFKINQTESIIARPMDDKLVSRLQRLGGNLPETVSGALHDSAVIAPHVPTVMLFVPSKDGISHNPAEFSRIEDIAAAAELVQKLVRQVSITQLNKMDRAEFIAVCGGCFEHSPWIAERAWDRRPFDSVDDLHEKLCSVVRAANAGEQLSLIRAHPDLVGSLAREGKLTRESTGEQAAAGLMTLTPEEIAAFERYNVAYRKKFDFPFIICARANKKEAILAAFPHRLQNDRPQEIAIALREIFKIARLRLMDTVSED